MKSIRLAFCLMLLLCCVAPAMLAQQETDKPSAKSEAPEPRTKDGKKLLTALDLLKVGAVAGPRVSPDGTRVAYTVSETKVEKDKEWKTVTQVWVVPLAGPTVKNLASTLAVKKTPPRLSGHPMESCWPFSAIVRKTVSARCG